MVLYLHPGKWLMVRTAKTKRPSAPSRPCPPCSLAHAALLPAIISSAHWGFWRFLRWRSRLGLRMVLSGDGGGGHWDPALGAWGWGQGRTLQVSPAGGCREEGWGSGWVTVCHGMLQRRQIGRNWHTLPSGPWGRPWEWRCSAAQQGPGDGLLAGPWVGVGGLDLLSGEFLVSLVTSGTLPETLQALEETGRSHGPPPGLAELRAEVISSVTTGQMALDLAIL